MECKFLSDGRKVAVIGSVNSKQFIVQEIFITESGDEIPTGESFVTGSLHDEPVKSYLDKKVEEQELRLKQLKDLVDKKKKEADLTIEKCKANAEILRQSNLVTKDLSNIDLDLFFIGAYNEKRVQYIPVLKKFAKENLLTYSFNIYIPIGKYIKKKLFDKSFNLKLEDIIFRKKSLTEVAKIIHRSNCVIEIVKEDQNGLTFRAFETLAANKKLITNTIAINREEFYDKRNIAFIDDINIDFIVSNFNKQSNLEPYYIDNWILGFFEDCKPPLKAERVL